MMKGERPKNGPLSSLFEREIRAARIGLFVSSFLTVSCSIIIVLVAVKLENFSAAGDESLGFVLSRVINSPSDQAWEAVRGVAAIQSIQYVSIRIVLFGVGLYTLSWFSRVSVANFNKIGSHRRRKLVLVAIEMQLNDANLGSDEKLKLRADLLKVLSEVEQGEQIPIFGGRTARLTGARPKN